MSFWHAFTEFFNEDSEYEFFDVSNPPQVTLPVQGNFPKSREEAIKHIHDIRRRKGLTEEGIPESNDNRKDLEEALIK